MNNLAASSRDITFAIFFFSQQAAGKRACELNAVNINPPCGIKKTIPQSANLNQLGSIE